jgi:membrane associated rhomboid family serine protease
VDTDSTWIEIYRSPASRDCDERALVVLSAGIAAAMRFEFAIYALLVPAEHAARALQEIHRYALENRRPPPPPPPPPLHRGAAASAAIYAALLFACAAISSHSLLGHDWAGSGVLDGARVRAGELWRAVTALTLHADLAHLLANIGFGALFGGLAARVYGPGFGWLLTLLAAVLANLANALTMADGRVSLGASTAVFAALGALAVHRWPARAERARPILAGGPVIAALVLLALLGTGDERTDIAAHALGIAFGAALALPLRRWAPPRRTLPQALAGAGAVALLVAGWAAAYWM